MRLRRFTENGSRRFEDFLDLLSDDPPPSVPRKLLKNDDATEVIEPAVELDESIIFESRLKCAEYLHNNLQVLGMHGVDSDVGMWSWLALFYFDQLCPEHPDGSRSPGKRSRWVLVGENHRLYYRHLLAGPYRIYRAHASSPEDAFVVLRGPLNIPGELVEQLSSSNRFVSNVGILGAARSLYVNDRGGVKRGAASKGPGSARRLVEVLNQFDLTYDLYAMNQKDLLGLLPEEFDRFKN